ncbi:MAG: radical SAM protein [Methylococcaceae bacterium]|nr:radical SAM protein [Methylococcaceae bacterium]MCI0734296.1 radical SAM protein [Methylococcaceae bacterium]
MTRKKKLQFHDHSRDSAGLRYVYPVVSRRAGGVSLGINLNPNNACNWRCVYCQVPDLKRGSAPTIDRDLLEHELRTFLDDALSCDFYDRYGVENGYRRLRDIAISGNGEPTSADDFSSIVDLIGRVMEDYRLFGDLNLVLISNGSLIHQPAVRDGLTRLHVLGGEVWFKVDSATDYGLKRINNAGLSASRARDNLQICAELCRTWVQTCVFTFRGESLSSEERRAYFDLIARTAEMKNHFRGVLVYGLARPSRQPERHHLSEIDRGWLETFVNELRGLPIEVRLSV